MPGFLLDAQQWAASGRIADTFTSLAYPLFAGIALRLGGFHGVVALQIALQVAFAGIAWRLLRQLRLSSRAAALGAALAALHPALVLSVSKVWDVPLSAALFVLLALCLLWLLRASPGRLLRVALLTGIVFGLGLSSRPNYLLLAPAIALALLMRRPRPRLGSASAVLVLTAASAAAAFALVGVASHGSVFLARNGPYNLFAGHNRHTVDSLLTNLNAEPSLVQCLSEQPHPDPDPYAAANEPWYRQQSLAFARNYPQIEVKLLLLKLWTLFRADTKAHPLGSVAGIGQLLLTAPVVLFFALLLFPPRPQLHREDAVLLTLELCYIIPFLLTNSDPRFRVPLDALLLLHAASLLVRRRSAPHDVPA